MPHVTVQSAFVIRYWWWTLRKYSGFKFKGFLCCQQMLLPEVIGLVLQSRHDTRILSVGQSSRLSRQTDCKRLSCCYVFDSDSMAVVLTHATLRWSGYDGHMEADY